MNVATRGQLRSAETPAGSGGAPPAAATSSKPSKPAPNNRHVSFAPLPEEQQQQQQKASNVVQQQPVQTSNGWVVLPMDAARVALPSLINNTAEVSSVRSAATSVLVDSKSSHSSSSNVDVMAACFSSSLQLEPRYDAKDYRKRRGTVCRLLKPGDRPEDCMFLVPSSNSSSFILPEIKYADSDSDAAFMRESFAKRHRIACKTLPGRFTHLRTVGG
jgi:hypothetical protein